MLFRSIPILLAGVIGFAALGNAPLATGADAVLIDPAKGQQFNDTGSDGQTKFSIVEHEALGGPALQVVFVAGDSAGDSLVRVKDWRPYESLDFEAVNPGAKPVQLGLAIRHRNSTNYQTRIDQPLTLAPGVNRFRIPLRSLQNVNGTLPDLGSVRHWYFADADRVAPTILFSKLRLVSPAATAATGGASGPLTLTGKFRVQGTIDGKQVDLTLSPGDGGVTLTPVGQAAAGGKIATDPARLARIRAAKMPEIKAPVMFDTPEADAILSALEVFPPDNAWNQLVTDWPVHPNSQAIIESVGADKPLRYNPDMAFILVPPSQPKQPVLNLRYADESDREPFPIPDNLPVEGWPVNYQGPRASVALTLDELQRDARGLGGDRHAIMVDPVNRKLYELYIAKKTDAGWEATQSSVFDLTSNKLRPEGWTSTDAAGLPIFPAIVRYDELQRGVIDHALRVTIRKSRRAYVSPATHYASRAENEEYPRMGERFRLRKDFDTSDLSPEAKIIAVALQRYGMLVADNGIEWAISVAPDPRIPVLHTELRKLKGSDFEVVVSPE